MSSWLYQPWADQLVLKSTSDSLTLGISESASVLITFRPISVSDTFSLGISDSGVVTKTSVPAADTFNFSIVDTASVLVTFLPVSVSDTFNFSIVDSPLAINKAAVTDTLTIGISEARTVRLSKIDIVASVASTGGAPTGGTAGFIDTTTAGMILASVSSAAGLLPTLTDNQVNNWISLGFTATTTVRCQVYAAFNPIKSALHSFTVTGPAGCYATVSVLAIKGASIYPPEVPDQLVANAVNSTLSITTIDRTPSIADELLVSALALAFNVSAAANINQGYTLDGQLAPSPGTYYGVALAHKYQFDVAATNPTWSWGATNDAATVLLTLRPAPLALTSPADTFSMSMAENVAAVTSGGFGVMVLDRFERDGLGSNWTVSPSFIAPLVDGSNGFMTSPGPPGGVAWWNAHIFTPDQFSEGTVTPFGLHSIGVLVRHQPSTSSFYSAIYDNNLQRVIIYRCDSGVYTPLFTSDDFSVSLITADRFRLGVVGNLLSVYINGNALTGIEATDNTYTSGSPGVDFQTDSGGYFAEWHGGSLGPLIFAKTATDTMTLSIADTISRVSSGFGVINMCGFEMQTSFEAQTTSSFTVTDVVRTGMAAARLLPTPGNSDYWMFSTHTPAGSRVALNRYETTYYTFWVRFEAFPNGGADLESVFAAVTQNSGTNVICKLVISNLGLVRLEGTVSTGTLAILSTGVWYRVDLRATTNGTCGVKIDGGGESTVPGGNFVQNAFTIGRDLATNVTGLNDNGYDMRVDDVVICAGSFPPSGDGVRMLLPNAAGTFSTWASGTGTTYTEVDDVPFDGDGTYIKTQSGSNKVHTFNMQDAAEVGISANILAVRVLAIGKTESSSRANTALRVRSGSNNYDTPVFAWNTNYNPFARTYVTDPNGEVPWTLSALNALECGIIAVTATTQHVSTVCAMIWSDGVPLSTPTAANDSWTLSVAESTDLVVRLGAMDAATLSIADSASPLITFLPLAVADVFTLSIAETTAQFQQMPVVDSWTLSISDVGNRVVTFLPISVADSFTLSIAETFDQLKRAPFDDTFDVSLSDTGVTTAKMTLADSLDLTFTDTAVADAKVPTPDSSTLSISEAYVTKAWVTPADTLTLSISEATILNVVVSGTDSLDLSIADSGSVIIKYLPVAAADTWTLSIDETYVTSAKVPAADTLTLFIAETAGEMMVRLSPVDTFTLSIAETTSGRVWTDAADSWTLSIAETTTLSLKLPVEDFFDLSLVDTANIANIKLSVTDSWTLSIAETTTGKAWPAVTDTLTLSIADVAAPYVRLASEDTLELSIAESSAQSLHLPVEDTLELSIADVPLAIYKISGVGDTLTLGISAVGDVVTAGFFPLDGTDSWTLSISETASITEKKFGTDLWTLSISEATAITAQIPAADSLVLDIAETTSGSRNLPVTDSLDITLTETFVTSAKMTVADSLGLSIADSAIIQSVKLAVADTLSISLVDSGSIFSAMLWNEFFTLGITETAVMVNHAAGTDSVTLSLDETTAIFSRPTSTDTLVLSISETARVQLFIGPTGIPTAEAVGQPSIALQISVSSLGIPSEEMVPVPLIDVGSILVFVAGVPSVEAVGKPTLEEMRVVQPDGISSEEIVGQLTLAAVLRPIGILSGELFGTAEIETSRPIRPVGIASDETFGWPFMRVPLFIYANSVPSGELFGYTFVGSFVAILPASAGTGETFGDVTLLGHARIYAWQIGSQEAFGTHRLHFPVQTLAPAGIASGEVLGAPALNLYVLPAGIGTQEAFGLAQFAYIIRPEGIQSGEAGAYPLILSTSGESIFEPVLSDDLFSSVFT